MKGMKSHFAHGKQLPGRFSLNEFDQVQCVATMDYENWTELPEDTNIVTEQLLTGELNSEGKLAFANVVRAVSQMYPNRIDREFINDQAQQRREENGEFPRKF